MYRLLTAKIHPSICSCLHCYQNNSPVLHHISRDLILFSKVTASWMNSAQMIPRTVAVGPGYSLSSCYHHLVSFVNIRRAQAYHVPVKSELA